VARTSYTLAAPGTVEPQISDPPEASAEVYMPEDALFTPLAFHDEAE
jgi:hypothetical protein